MKVLVADDDASVRGLVQRLLTGGTDVDVVSVGDGAAALGVLLAESVDLLITDLSMPVMGGLETLEVVRASARFGTLPVVVMTAQPGEADFMRAQSLGIQGFLVKPFSVPDFRAHLDPLLRSVQSQRSTAGLTPGLLTIRASDRLLVVDQSPAFRAVAEAVFSRLSRVETAEHEFVAIRACVDAPPDVVVIGVTSDLMPMPALVDKIRGLTKRNAVSLIAAVGSGDVDATKSAGRFDAVTVRSMMTDAFEGSVGDVIDAPTRARLLLHPTSSWMSRTLETSADHIGEFAAVAASTHAVRPRLDEAVRWVASDVELQGTDFGWALRLRCPVHVALEMSHLRNPSDDDRVSDQAALRTVTALATTLGQVWCEQAKASGLACAANTPITRVQTCLGAGPDTTVPLHSRRWLTQGERDLAILEVIPLTGVPS